MKQLDDYSGNEQTYVKHFFLDNYLEGVAYRILSFRDVFVYVDGFAGPWKSKDQKFDDTSFAIAIHKLASIQQQIARTRGKPPVIKCLFIEKDRAAYEQLEEYLKRVKGVEVKPLHGSFEDLVPQIISFIGNDFSLSFIDPTGWTGFSLKKISPLLQLKGEVIINLMSSFVIRFDDPERTDLQNSFDALFGDNVWGKDIEKGKEEGLAHSDAAALAYIKRLKRAGGYKYATYTEILNPKAEKTHFHLVYATRHWKGSEVFRQVERRSVEEQNKARKKVKAENRIKNSGQPELFDPYEEPRAFGKDDFATIREVQKCAAFEALIKFLEKETIVTFEELLGEILQYRLIWKPDLQGFLKTLEGEGRIVVHGRKARERTYKKGHKIQFKK